MSNETTPQLVECRIKSFETNGNEWTTVTLQIPEHITDAVVKASTSREPMLRVLVEAVPAVPAQGASASNETTTIKVTATPEWLAEQAVTRVSSAGIVLKRADGRTVVHFGRQHVHAPEGEQLAAVRAWLVEQIRGAYKAGVESVAQTKADGAACLVETYGPDALAKAREEGRRQGLRQAADRVQRYLAETQEIGVECDEQIEALREGIKSKEDIRRSIAQKAEAYRTALADLKKQIDKEPA